jgi:hypothetical protein
LGPPAAFFHDARFSEKRPGRRLHGEAETTNAGPCGPTPLFDEHARQEVIERNPPTKPLQIRACAIGDF